MERYGRWHEAEALKRLTEFRKLFSKRTQYVSLAKSIWDLLTFAEATHLPCTFALYRHALIRLWSTTGVMTEHVDKYRSRHVRETTEAKRDPSRAASSP